MNRHRSARDHTQRVMQRDRFHIFSELLVLQAQLGDEQAIDELVRLWTDRLACRARRLLGDDDGVLDVVQETWLGIARGLRSLNDPALFGPWAYRIVSNKCADVVRRRVNHRKLRHDASAAEQASRSDGDTRDEIGIAVREAICLLPTDLRAVVVFHYMDGLGVEAIASIMQVPAGTDKTRLMRARSRLKPLIENSL